MDSYPTQYADAYGTEAISITNDGETLRMTLRGLEFSGSDFDDLRPSEAVTPEQRRRVPLHHDRLCSCRLECRILLPVWDHGRQRQGELVVALVLGDPAPHGGLDRQELRLTLAYSEGRFSSSGKAGVFEDDLLHIQAQLPDGVYMKACINCLYSDYSPYGQGMFGTMLCFRNHKAAYLKVTSKDDFWSIHDDPDRMVQETYLCPEFERRVPGTGYRG